RQSKESAQATRQLPGGEPGPVAAAATSPAPLSRENRPGTLPRRIRCAKPGISIVAEFTASFQPRRHLAGGAPVPGLETLLKRIGVYRHQRGRTGLALSWAARRCRIR